MEPDNRTEAETAVYELSPSPFVSAQGEEGGPSCLHRTLPKGTPNGAYGGAKTRHPGDLSD